MSRKEKLTEMGWTVIAEVDDALFMAINNQGFEVILHFYEDGLDETPMVEGFTLNSFRDDEIERLQMTPRIFLEDFDVTNAIPDWKAVESEWVFDH